jgi:hypothetical protein
MTQHLWEMDTAWFIPSPTDMNISYMNWKNFQDNTPDFIFNQHIMTSWSWANDNLQIIFANRTRSSVTYIQIPVTQGQEQEIRAWIKKHKPQFWDL